MNDFDSVIITDCQIITADDILAVMIADFHQVVGFTGGFNRKFYTDLNIYFFISANTDKIDFLGSILSNIDIIPST